MMYVKSDDWMENSGDSNLVASWKAASFAEAFLSKHLK